MKPKQTLTRRDFLRYSALSGSAALLVACAPAAPAASGEAAPAAAADEAPAAEMSGPKQGGTMTWVGHQEVAGLNPAFMGPTVHWVMIINIHNPLVTVNEFNELENVLAQSVDVSDDGLTYTFQLHEGVLFHDGSELTAEDVAYTYNYYRNPENGAPIVGSFTGIASVEAPDKYTVQVNMENVNAASLASWATVPIVHSAYHAEVGEETYSTSPIGTGAYKLRRVAPGRVYRTGSFR